MTSTPPRLALVLLATFATLSAGCAAQKNAAYPQEPAPRTVEEAEVQINGARAALGLPPAKFAPERVSDGIPDSADAPAPSPATPTDPVTPAEAASAPSPRAESAPDQELALSSARAESPCMRACRAFASMRRASDALCRIAGEHDGRCTEARRAVRESEAKLEGCSC